MPRLRGVERARATATKDEAARIERSAKAKDKNKKPAKDSYQNFMLNLGMGTDNPLAASTYGFNPITRNRVLLEWMHRGSWLAGVAIDIIPSDMTRAGIDIQSSISPGDSEKLKKKEVSLNIWNALCESNQWARLYGGGLAVFMIDGQDMKQPLRIETVGKDQFKGLMVLDRWMVEPTLDNANIVQDMGPDLGMPMYYKVNTTAPTFWGRTIHYSRVIRFDGIKLPYWQRVMENLWGISVLERLYDRLIAFDSATQGVAQLLYKSNIRTYKVDKMRELLASGGPAEAVLTRYVNMMRQFQSNEGITIIDGLDDLVIQQNSGGAGYADCLLQFGQQLSGALEIPLVRLFGQSPAGLNSTGESDLRTYYDGIKQKQERTMRVGVDKLYQVMARSENVNLGDKFGFEFASLWQLSDEKAAQVDQQDTTSVREGFDAGLISQKTALQELRQRGRPTSRWTNITDEMIEKADDEVAPSAEELGLVGPDGKPIDPNDEGLPEDGVKGGDPNKVGKKSNGARDGRRMRDGIPYTEIMGHQVAIEARAGTNRWAGHKALTADYGYIRRMPSAEGPLEWMDCFVGPSRDSDAAFVIDQEIGDKFDEHKVMLGFRTKAEAVDCYNTAYQNVDAVSIGAVTEMQKPELVEWLASCDVKTPAADWRRK